MAEKKALQVNDSTALIVDDNIVKLHSPLADGRDTLELNLRRLNGYALIKCEREAKKMDPGILVPSLSQAYQAQVAAMAAQVKVDDIFSLDSDDFTNVMIRVQTFLLGNAAP